MPTTDPIIELTTGKKPLAIRETRNRPHEFHITKSHRLPRSTTSVLSVPGAALPQD